MDFSMHLNIALRNPLSQNSYASERVFSAKWAIVQLYYGENKLLFDEMIMMSV